MTTILIILAIIVAILIFGKSRLSKLAKNRISDITDSIADSLSNPIKDGEADIKAAQSEVGHLNSTIAELITSTKQLETRTQNLKQDVTKFDNIAVAAGKAGNREDVITAVTQKSNAEKQAATLTKEIEKNHSLETQLKAQVKTLSQKIADAQNGKVRLAAVLESSALREKIAKAAAGSTSEEGLAGLDNLAKAADEAEARATAWEDIANTSTEGTATSLEKKYSGAAVSEDEISKYIKATA
jgi:phage shock protein A